MHAIAHLYLTHPVLIFFLFLKLIYCLLIFILFLLNTFVGVFPKWLFFLIQPSSFFSTSRLSSSPFLTFSTRASLLFSFLSPLSVSSLILLPTFPPCSRKVARSESARVDRHSSRRRGSSRAKQSRSRSDVDLQPPATTPTTTLFNPQLLHP